MNSIPSAGERKSSSRVLLILNAQPLINGLQHSLNINIHANPFGTRAPVAINPAIDVVSFYANVIRIQASVTPPLSRSKKTDDWCPRCYSQVCWPGVATHVDFGLSHQGVEPFQRKTR